MAKLLLVDDEDQFRNSLATRLVMRGYTVEALADGGEAIKRIRSDSNIDVLILDRKMPGMGGEEVLREVKRYRPELQVIFLTGHSSMESAMEVGRLEAYAYLEKPCELEQLVAVIDTARADVIHAKNRHEIPHVEQGSILKWLRGSHNSRPGVLFLGLLLFLGIILSPTPDRLAALLSAPKTGTVTDPHLGYASYGKLHDGETVAQYYARTYGVGDKVAPPAGGKSSYRLDTEQAAFRAKVMLGILLLAALFWATGAIPIGVTALLVGTMMFFFGILRPDDVAKAYAKDAVIFIFGVLVLSRVISHTGLDRRIALLMMRPARS
ncbi:MAG: SLC13 family permease, partial [bacterium]